MSARKELNIPLTAGFQAEMGNTSESRAAWFHSMQETQPIRYRSNGGFWEVFRYDDVQHVLTDHATFSVHYIRLAGRPDVDSMSNTDPPAHRQLRNLVSQAFTPRYIARLAPRIQAIVDELLEKIGTSSSIDISQQFAYLFPIRVIAEMLGVSSEDQEQFRRWSYQLLGVLPHPNDPNHDELAQYFMALLDRRQKEPQDDLMSALLAVEVDGERMSREQVRLLCELLLLAGNVTTTMLINHTFHRFLKQPEIVDELRQTPSLIPGALEEVLRYEFSSSNMVRLVKQPTVLSGQELKEGDVVMAWLGAANFDERYFPHPEHFDIRRSPNPHITFGYGAHYCLGAPLARLEGKIALERMLVHMRDIRPDPERSIQYLEPKLDFIWRLPILFTPS